jgi:hypothetical protein
LDKPAAPEGWFPRLRAALARRRTRWVALAPFFALVVWREPDLFFAPRFWAEEGTNYFRHALEHPWTRALFDLSAVPYNPYWHPIPHLSTIAAANWGSLESAPAFTTAAWCLVVLALALVVLYGRAELLNGAWRRAVGLLAPLLAVANSENWVSTLGAHFFCDIALLLLVLEAEKVEGKRRILSLAAFGVLALISPTSWLLVPAALFLAYRNLRAHRAYVVALGVMVAFHVILSVFGFPVHPREPPELAAAPHLWIVKLLLWPLAGHRIADAYADFAVHATSGLYLGLSVGLGVLTIALYLGTWIASRRDTTTAVLLLTHAAAAAGALLLGLHVGKTLLPVFHGGRYAWLPNALLLLLLIHQLDSTNPPTRAPSQGVFAALFAAAVAAGVVQFRYPEPVRAWARAPSWQEEVKMFRDNPAYDRLRIAPSGWVVVLPAEKVKAMTRTWQRVSQSGLMSHLDRARIGP